MDKPPQAPSIDGPVEEEGRAPHWANMHDAVNSIPWADVGKQLGLSGREIDIARLLCQGRTTFSIACQLGISVNTVKIHLKRLYKKCHVHNRASLVMLVLSAVSADHLDPTHP